MGEQKPWIWRSRPLAQQTGSEIFRRLFGKNCAYAVLLESPFPVVNDQPQLSRFSLCAGNPRVNEEGKWQVWTPPVGKILPCLRQLSQRSSELVPESVRHLPFTGGYFGWLGYDLAWEIEVLPQLNDDSLPFPIAYWYEAEMFAVLDHQEQVLWLAASHSQQLDALERAAETPFPNDEVSVATTNVSPPTFLTAAADYQDMVRRAKEYIYAGDIFQTNLSLRFQATTQGSSWQIYQALQRINPSPFSSYWRTPWGDVISCSPERLVQRRGNLCETRPIAGTRPRGETNEIDVSLATELRQNQKEQAEHIMLVDLERNDLGRVCEWGTVKVDELLTIERYSHVMHLVSNVQGKLEAQYDSVDLIRALFPGGTITGCPKVRCLEIIEELEPFRRSLFYGSCGYLDQRGNLDLNILIRTLLYHEGTVWGQVGAGIVADSNPQKEWEESLSKGKAQVSAIAAWMK
ncbi:MAG: anthranilate synthase component I [Halothece sp.]